MPTEAVRSGDLSVAVEPDLRSRRPARRMASAAQPFSGNIIPQDRIDRDCEEDHRSDADAESCRAKRTTTSRRSPFEFNRWTLDTKVNWNATSKLNIFGRYSHLDFWTFNEAVYGDVLQGVPMTLAAIPEPVRAIRRISRRAARTCSRRASWLTRTSDMSACTPMSRTRTSARTRAWICSAFPV